MISGRRRLTFCAGGAWVDMREMYHGSGVRPAGKRPGNSASSALKESFSSRADHEVQENSCSLSVSALLPGLPHLMILAPGLCSTVDEPQIETQRAAEGQPAFS